MLMIQNAVLVLAEENDIADVSIGLGTEQIAEAAEKWYVSQN